MKVCVGLLGGTEVWNNWQAYTHFTPPPNDARTHPFKLLLETVIVQEILERVLLVVVKNPSARVPSFHCLPLSTAPINVYNSDFS